MKTLLFPLIIIWISSQTVFSEESKTLENRQNCQGGSCVNDGDGNQTTPCVGGDCGRPRRNSYKKFWSQSYSNSYRNSNRNSNSYPYNYPAYSNSYRNANERITPCVGGNCGGEVYPVYPPVGPPTFCGGGGGSCGGEVYPPLPPAPCGGGGGNCGGVVYNPPRPSCEGGGSCSGEPIIQQIQPVVRPVQQIVRPEPPVQQIVRMEPPTQQIVRPVQQVVSPVQPQPPPMKTCPQCINRCFSLRCQTSDCFYNCLTNCDCTQTKTEAETQVETREEEPTNNCCYVMHPKQCYTDESGNRRCFIRRHKECSDTCTSSVVSIQERENKDNARPACHYIQNYPYVYCGNYERQNCGQCYDCGGGNSPGDCFRQSECTESCRRSVPHVY